MKHSRFIVLNIMYTQSHEYRDKTVHFRFPSRTAILFCVITSGPTLGPAQPPTRTYEVALSWGPEQYISFYPLTVPLTQTNMNFTVDICAGVGRQ